MFFVLKCKMNLQYKISEPFTLSASITRYIFMNVQSQYLKVLLMQ